jgi:hypothetical protein
MLKHLLIILTALTVISCVHTARADDTGSDGAPRHKPNVKAWKTDRANGKKAFEQKQYAQADHFYRAALAEARNFDAKDDRLAESLLDLGEFYAETGNLGPAEPLLREVVQVRHDDPSPLLEAQSIAPYAIVSMKLGHYNEAAKTYARIQELLSRKFGADHPLVVDAMLQRGIAYYEEGDLAQAEPLLKRSASLFQNPTSRVIIRPTEPAFHGSEIYRRTYRPNFANALQALGFLSSIYIQQGKLDDAQACLKNSLKIVDENDAKGDPALPDALRQLSAFYLSTTNYPAAEPIMQRLVRLDEKNLGAANAATVTAQTELADVYLRDQKPADAEALYKKVLAASEQNSGPDSRETILLVGHLAKFYFERQDYAQAEPLYRREAEHAEKFQSSDLPEILSDEATIYEKLGRDADLAAVYQKQIAAYEKMFGPDSRALVKPLTDCAAALRREKKDSEAQAMEVRVKAIQAAQSK